MDGRSRRFTRRMRRGQSPVDDIEVLRRDVQTGSHAVGEDRGRSELLRNLWKTLPVACERAEAVAP